MGLLCNVQHNKFDRKFCSASAAESWRVESRPQPAALAMASVFDRVLYGDPKSRELFQQFVDLKTRKYISSENKESDATKISCIQGCLGAPSCKPVVLGSRIFRGPIGPWKILLPRTLAYTREHLVGTPPYAMKFLIRTISVPGGLKKVVCRCAWKSAPLEMTM